MIEFYHRIGKSVFPFRLVFWALLLVSTIRAGMIIFSNDPTYDEQLLMLLVFSVWFVLVLSVCYFFRQIAVRPEGKVGLLKRLSISIKRAFSFLIAILFSVHSVLVMFFYIKSNQVLGSVKNC